MPKKTLVEVENEIEQLDDRAHQLEDVVGLLEDLADYSRGLVGDSDVVSDEDKKALKDIGVLVRKMHTKYERISRNTDKKLSVLREKALELRKAGCEHEHVRSVCTNCDAILTA